MLIYVECDTNINQIYYGEEIMTVEYHLYLDESETHFNSLRKHFCIAGIIVEKNYHDTTLTADLNAIKNSIWGNTSYILHEKDIRFAQNRMNRYLLSNVDPHYRIFQHNRPNNLLYNGLKNIVQKPDVTVIGGCIVEDDLYNHYDRRSLPDRTLIIMQVIIENFCNFLKRNNAKGRIFYEWVDEPFNNTLRRRFNQVELTGTMYVNSKTIQDLIYNIQFPKKNENIPGLQVADFVPGNLARHIAGKPRSQFNLSDAVRIARYDGGIMKHDRFGVKIIPRN